MDDITIRFAGPGDGEPLAAMIDALDHHYGDPPRRAGDTRPAADRWLNGEGTDTHFALAFAGGQVVGFACYAVLHPGNRLKGQLYLKDLFLAAEWRGRGVGEGLMRFLASFCRRTGIGRIDWLVEEPRSEAFYAHLGAAVLPRKRSMRLDGQALADLADN